MKKLILLIPALFLFHQLSMAQAGVGCPTNNTTGLSDTVIANSTVTYIIDVVNTGSVALSGSITIYIGNYDSTNTFYLVDSIVFQPNNQPFNPGDTQQVLVTHQIDSTKFMEGNNTVVIWPQHFFAPTTDTTSKVIFVIYFNDVEEFEIAQVKMFPNPVSEYLNIVANEQIELVRIFDLNGRLVRMQKFPKTISVADLENGLYLIELKSVSGKYKRLKFVKE